MRFSTETGATRFIPGRQRFGSFPACCLRRCTGREAPRGDGLSWFFDVEVEDAAPSGDAVWSIDFPRSGTRVYGDRLDIAGWAMGTRSAAEVRAEGDDSAQPFPTRPRPDVAAAFEEMPHALNSGFYLLAGIPDAPQAEIRVSIIVAGGRPVEGPVIHLTRGWSDPPSGAEAPLVSVVIPCYNQAQFLREAIASARRQTYPNVEIVVVDDGSTDETSAVAAEFEVRCIRQENSGVVAARNRGLAASNGQYVVFLDADDLLLPHALEANVLAFQARPDAAFVSGWGRHITAAGEFMLPQRPPTKDPYAAFLETSYQCEGTEMFRRDRVIGVGGYHGSGAEDWDLYLRLAREHPVYAHDCGPICEYRQRSVSRSMNSPRALRRSLSALRAQRRWTRHDDSLRAAYKRGVSIIQEIYGERVAEDLAAAARGRRLRDAISCAWALVRFYPQGFSSSLSRLRGTPLRA
jgi:glycosyltransferase involved in cell wall biosynthesis